MRERREGAERKSGGGYRLYMSTERSPPLPSVCPLYHQITYVKEQMKPIPIHVGLIVRISLHSFEK